MSNASDKRKIQLEPEVNAAAVRPGVDATKAALNEMGEAGKRAGEQANEGLTKIGEGGKKAAEKVEHATQSMIAAVQRATAVTKAGQRGTADYYEELGRQRGVSGDALKPWIDNLRAAEAAQKSATKSLGGMQTSAAQTAAALRQLPAQFTDIVTSLQGGQAPLTVLLQQGGQIKDSFGGAGAAAKALGGYVIGLVSPFTLAAAAAGVLAFGLLTGAAQSEALRKSVILTGQAVGLTAGQLGDMAGSISRVAGSQARASETLSAFVEGTSVGADKIERFARVALQFERAGGAAVSDTVKAFSDLEKDPVRAIEKLNERTNFLTASVYLQIKALQDQGRETEASAAAQSAYATALESRTPKLAENLGLLARLWRDVKDATAGAVDAVQSVGRDSTINDQIKALQTQRAGAAGRAHRANGGGLLDNLVASQANDEVKRIDAVLVKLRESKKTSEDLARLAAERNEQEQARIKWLADGDRFLTKQQQAEREIAAIRQQGLKAGADQAEIDRRVTAAKAKFADPGGDNELAGLRAKLKETDKYIAALGLQGAATRELNEGEKTALKLREQLATNLSSSTRAEKEQALALAETLGQRQRMAEGLKEDITLAAKSADQVGKEADAIRQRAAEQEAANATFGNGKTAIEAMTLAQLKDQAVAAESASFDEKFRASLDAKVAAQERYVKALQAADFKTLSQGAQEWLRASSEAATLQAAEPAMLALSSAERQKITANREVELKLAREIAAVEKSSLSDAEKAAVVGDLRAAAAQDRARNETAASQAALREIDDFLDPGRAESFGAALSRAFEGAGNSLAKLSNSLGDFAQQQSAITRKQATVDQITDPLKKQAAQLKLNEKSQQNQISLYANLAGAAKGFFSEGSKGYKALEAAETAFRLVQLASNLQQGLSAAAVAIANQGKGDPYTAFPRMAVMAGAMATLGFAVGWAGGGGSGGSGDGAKQATGTGTVFGDTAAKSESIANSIDRLADTSKLQLTTQSGMLAALRNIESNIGGLSNLVLRSAAIGDPAGQFGIKEGASLNAFNSFGKSALLILDSWTSNVFTKLMGSKTSVTGNGLFAGAQGLGSIVANGLNLQDFVDVEKKNKFFGITVSSSNSSQYRPADAQLAQQFGQVFKDFYGAISQAAVPLGAALGDVKSRLDGFVVDIGKIDLSGLTGTQIQEKLGAVLGAAADNIAAVAIPGLQSFERVGEGYFETLIRVAAGVEEAKVSLANLGIAAVSFGDITRKQGDVAAEMIRQSIAAFETAGGTLSSVGSLINNLDAGGDDLVSAYKSLVDVRDMLVAVGASGNALTAAMLQGAGGIDNLASSLSAYLQGPFFSDQERAAAAASSLATQFARIGIDAVPTSYQGFRQLVQGIDQSTEAGQRLYGQVVGLAGAFQTAQEAADKAAVTLVSRLPDILKSQAAEGAGLMVDLLKAKGDTAGAAALKRAQDLAALTAGLTEAEAAAAMAGYDYIASLRAQIDAQGAAAQAAAAEATRVASVSSQRANLEGQLLQAQGNTAALRERELAALDPSIRAIQARIFALQDEQAAAQQLGTIASQRESIQAQIDQALGNTAAIRERELLALDPSNRALQERFFAIQDEQAAQELAARAAEQAAQAAEQAAQAADQLRQAWQSVTDTLFDEVKRIRSLNGAGAATSLAQAKTNFAITTAQARANDQDAARMLPALSQAILSLAESQGTSARDLRVLRAQMAASLNTTATQLAGRLGLTVPRLATGTNEVPADMLAILHKGEAVVPKPFNPTAVGAGRGNDALLAELRGLRADQRTQASAMAKLQSDLLKLQKKWDLRGLPQERQEEVSA